MKADEVERGNACQDEQSEGKYKMPLWIKAGIVVFALAFAVAGFITGRKLYMDHQGEQAYESLRMEISRTQYEESMAEAKKFAPTKLEPSAQIKQMNFAPLREVNEDIVAWLKLEGSVIDYPVMHGDDNDYYLSHIYTGEANGYGAPFADYRNTGLFTDKNTVIYGHNMQDGSMFNKLSDYKSQAYYEQFPTMTLYTPDGDYTLELISGTVESGDSQFVQFDFDTDEEFLDYVNSFVARSTFTSNVEISAEDRLVSLCTCSYEVNNARYMVICRLVPVYAE